MTDSALHFALYPDHVHSRRVRRLVAAAALVGCTLVLATGCGSKSPSAAPKSLTPQQVVAAAALRSAKITSATAVMTESVGGGAGEIISGTVQEQLKPTLLVGMRLRIKSGGASQAIDGVVTNQAIYLKLAALERETGKQWLKVPFAAVDKGNSSLAQVFKSLSKFNPAQQTAVFSGAKNVRKTGSQVIDGVQTTRYSGSIVPAAALAKMPAGLRKALAPGMKTISGNPQFTVWIDGQGQVRKTVLNETVSGQTLISTITFSSINQPVHVVLPPASQVADLPASALGGTSS